MRSQSVPPILTESTATLAVIGCPPESAPIVNACVMGGEPEGGGVEGQPLAFHELFCALHGDFRPRFRRLPGLGPARRMMADPIPVRRLDQSRGEHEGGDRHDSEGDERCRTRFLPQTGSG